MSNRLKKTGICCTPGDIVITTADNTFLKKLIKILTRENRGIGVDKICYFGCLQAIKSLQLDVHQISSSAESGFDVDQAIELVRSEKIKTLFVNPTLSNPLGYTISEPDRIRLVRACQEHECFIIEDDIFYDLQNSEHIVRPLKAWDRKGFVIYLGSVSKAVAPGLRAGWCLPGTLYQELVSEMLSENISVSSPAQMITSQLLKSDVLSDHLTKIRATFAHQNRELTMIIGNYFPTGTAMSNPNGGGVYWITLPTQTNINRFFDDTKAKGIKVSRGSVFGADYNDPSFRLCLTNRLNLRSKAAIIEIGRIAHNNQIGPNISSKHLYCSTA